MRTPKRALLLVPAALLAIAAATAHADTAESLKQEGMAAAQQKNWVLAREKFAASYKLDPRPLTLFNLAAAQEKSGQLIAARGSYRSFLEKSPRGRETDQWRAIAQTRLTSLDKEIPTLNIQISGFTAGTSVELDGGAIAAAQIAAPIPVDPGDHALIVRREGAAVVRRSLGIARGDRAEIELTVPPPGAKVTPAPAPSEPAQLAPAGPPAPRPRKREGVLASPWFWGITGAVVVGTAGGLLYVYGSPDPTRGTLGPGTLEVR